MKNTQPTTQWKVEGKEITIPVMSSEWKFHSATSYLENTPHYLTNITLGDNNYTLVLELYLETPRDFTTEVETQEWLLWLFSQAPVEKLFSEEWEDFIHPMCFEGCPTPVTRLEGNQLFTLTGEQLKPVIEETLTSYNNRKKEQLTKQKVKLEKQLMSLV
jgi:hypothetical protein